MTMSALIDEAAARLLAAAPPGSWVILFGSHATGTADERSDVDFLVVEPEIEDRVQEMLRLDEAIRPLRLPADLLVLSRRAFDRWKDVPNTNAYRVASEGKTHGSAT